MREIVGGGGGLAAGYRPAAKAAGYTYKVRPAPDCRIQRDCLHSGTISRQDGRHATARPQSPQGDLVIVARGFSRRAFFGRILNSPDGHHIRRVMPRRNLLTAHAVTPTLTH